MSFATIAFPDYPRAQLREAIRATSKVPPDKLDEVVDIACHAAHSARLKLLEVLDTASDERVTVTAAGPAFSLLEHDVKIMIEALRAYARVSGKPATDVQLEVPA